MTAAQERYRCNKCEIEFDFHPSGEERLRCPQCLRQLGLEKVGAGAPAKRRSRDGGGRRLLVIVVISILALVAVSTGGVLLHRRTMVVPERGQLAVLSEARLAHTLRQRGLADKFIESPFALDRDLAQAIAGEPGSGKLEQRVARLAATLGAKLAGVNVLVSHLQGQEIRTASRLAPLVRDGKLKRATSLELAALLAGVLRAQRVDAVVCELEQIKAPVTSPDPTGVIGRYAVAVYAPGKLDQAPLAVFDPARAARLPEWAGGGGVAAMTSLDTRRTALGDGSVVGRFLALRAVAAIERSPKDEATVAYELTSEAAKAAAPSATISLGRAIVLAQTGGIPDAVAAARQAFAVSSDPPRATALARFAASSGDAQNALKLLEQAIKIDANFWPARATLATLAWINGDKTGGDQHFEVAKKVAPEEPQILALRASRRLIVGEVEQAISLLRRAAERQPSEAILFKLYIALRQQGASAADEAKSVKARLLRVASDPKMIEQALAQAERPLDAPPTSQPSGAASSGAPPAMPTMPRIKLPDVKLGQ